MDPELYHRLFPVFIAEALQNLDAMDEGLLQLDRNPGDADAIGRIARAAHTIKGNAAALGMRQMVVEAQRIEWWALDAPPTRAAASLASLHGARRELRRLIDEVSDDVGLTGIA